MYILLLWQIRHNNNSTGRMYDDNFNMKTMAFLEKCAEISTIFRTLYLKELKPYFNLTFVPILV